MNEKGFKIMKKKYLAAAAIAVGLFVTPAVASALATEDQADRVPVVSEGQLMSQMHDSVFGPDADGSGYEWMSQMHGSAFGPDADGSGYEWMSQMHGSLTDGSGDSPAGGMMGFSG